MLKLGPTLKNSVYVFNFHLHLARWKLNLLTQLGKEVWSSWATIPFTFAGMPLFMCVCNILK